MGVLDSIVMGFSVAFSPANLFFCFVGVLIGTFVGVLPGLGPSAAMSLLLPLTFRMSPISGIIMLAGIYYGVMYGGSTTSILVNIPGESASVVTCIDGYKMARKGRAGPALGIVAFGSFIAGTVGTAALMLAAPPLAEMALKIGPAEYFALMIMGLTLVTFLSSGPMNKALLMAGIGLFLGTIGLDNITGTPRFTAQSVTLLDGLGIIPVIMGLFGIAEVFSNLEGELRRDIFQKKVTHLLPTLQDWLESRWAILRGTIIGFLIGVLPGGSGTLSSFVSYAVEKRCSKTPEKFGSGMIAGVAGPESANNSATSGAFVPMLTLGIPPTPLMAILIGALIIHGIQPGPLLIDEHPDLFWGVIASMYIGNGMLLILNLPLIGLWVRILLIPYGILFPLIILFCLVGAYTLSYNIKDVYVMIIFGILGYMMRKYKYDAPPLVLGFVLSSMTEESLRRSLLLSNGSFMIFIERPIPAGIFSLIFLLTVVFPLVPQLMKKREKIALEDDV